MQPEIGVFICDCGKTLKNIDFPGLRARVASLPNVVYAVLRSDLCLKEGLEAMLCSIKEKDISRVVIAACSPNIKETRFQSALEEAGLESNLHTWANLREQCSWAHHDDATLKAFSLIKMAVSKAQLLHPLKKEQVPVNQRALIIGGGFSGLKVALELSELGINATLVETKSELGGRLKQVESIYAKAPDPSELVSSLAKRVVETDCIEVLTSTEITGVKGTAGHFEISMKRNGEALRRTFGAIVVASGCQTEVSPQLKPGSIIPSSEFLKLLQQQQHFPKEVAFLLDVSDEHSRLPTLCALNNALMANQRLGSGAYVFAKHLKIDSDDAEKLYREARQLGVMFLKFEERPRVSCEDGRVRVEVKDVLLGEEVTLYCDLLVVEDKPLPSPELASTLCIGNDSQGFYQEVNAHLSGVLSSRKGLFFAGSCRADLDLARTSTDAVDAAFKVYGCLACGRLDVEAEKVKVDPDKCRACLTCLRACPHGAILVEHAGEEKDTARIYDLACDGCGICVALCPAKAINFEGCSDEQIFAEIEAIGMS